MQAMSLEDCFVCAVCEQRYEKGRSDEEALAELHRDFPNVNFMNVRPVCDGCYQMLKERERNAR